jgi:uncharacterized membrane protein YhhN
LTCAIVKTGNRRKNKENKQKGENKMKITGKTIISALLIVSAILLEVFWIQTGSTVLGVFTVIVALVASGASARAITLDYASSNAKLRKYLNIVGLEN